MLHPRWQDRQASSRGECNHPPWTLAHRTVNSICRTDLTRLCLQFWSDPASGVDLDVNITVRGGPNPGFDETFVRNFYGYLLNFLARDDVTHLAQIPIILHYAESRPESHSNAHVHVFC
jgi:hypothetical protein